MFLFGLQPILLITTHFLNFAFITVILNNHHHQGNLLGNKWLLLTWHRFNLPMFQVTYMESTSFYWTDGCQRSVGWFWMNYHWSCTRVHIHTHKFVLVKWGWELRTKLTIWYATLMTYNFSTTNILKPVWSYSGMCNIQFKFHTKTTDCNASEWCVASHSRKTSTCQAAAPFLFQFISYITEREWSDKGIPMVLQL